jgi:predicted RNA-binding Zn-ribbon protein involved in translation (DUF1610 family)
MQTPTAAGLLDAWERALGESPTGRALGLLAACHPDAADGELAALPIGARDARLLRLRQHLFGSQLALVVPCPQCGEQLESRVDVDDLAADAAAPQAAVHSADCDGYRVSFRLPTSVDLLALPVQGERAQAAAQLIRRCLLEARAAGGAAAPVDTLPEAVIARIARHMESADPGADLELDFTCPACGHGWREPFDIAGHLWREVHAWAQRTLRDVHALARAYGWREADVLALSPTRRQIYLELCRQ